MSRKLTELINNNEFTYSLEVTPEIKLEDLDNLELNPIFFSITWHAQMHKCESLEIPPLKLAKYLRDKGKHVLLHLSCSLLRREYLDSILTMLQSLEICNLFVILGEGFQYNNSDFSNTKDLITHIRNATGNYFCIGVAGFPGCDDKLDALKEKIDSGADFIITQAFFELDLFTKYLSNCKNIGITVPILPGIFSFETESELCSFVNLCKVHINDDLKKNIKEENGLEIVAKLVNNIMAHTNIKHFHYFTINKMQKTANLIKLIK